MAILSVATVNASSSFRHKISGDGTEQDALAWSSSFSEGMRRPAIPATVTAGEATAFAVTRL